jgi:hypothetical protein
VPRRYNADSQKPAFPIVNGLSAVTGLAGDNGESDRRLTELKHRREIDVVGIADAQ